MIKYNKSESFELVGPTYMLLLEKHIQRTGKMSVSDFTDEEKKALQDDFRASEEKSHRP